MCRIDGKNVGRHTRREFVVTAIGSTVLTAVGAGAGASAAKSEQRAKARQAACEMLDEYVVERDWVDAFLDPKARVWAKFDPELGYLLRNSFMRDGVDGSHTLARYELSGQRKQVNFADQPCRINTYGNSFTQGHQVSDGETWQEVLAAHFCEPIRNFGIGGFGVYQAYRRLLRKEATDLAAPFVIFNIWGDDHLRSVNSWRWLTMPSNAMRAMGKLMFHSNPWAHARLDPNTGELIEKPNLLTTPESVYKLCDREFVHEAFAEDDIVQVLTTLRNPSVADPEVLDRLASACLFQGLDLSTPESTAKTVEKLYHTYAVRVGMKIMERTQAFCQQNGKRLLVLLSYPSGAIWNACNNSPPDAPGNTDWHPQVFKDFLSERKIAFVDTVQKHVAEYKTFRLSPKDYVDRYYIGHYNPIGNGFFAYAVKDEIVEWLDPKPPAYRNDKETLIRFEGYLPG